MDKYHSVAQEIRQFAGNVRVFAELLRPVPYQPEVDRTLLMQGMEQVARELERLALKTEACRICPFKAQKEKRP